MSLRKARHNDWYKRVYTSGQFLLKECYGDVTVGGGGSGMGQGEGGRPPLSWMSFVRGIRWFSFLNLLPWLSVWPWQPQKPQRGNQFRNRFYRCLTSLSVSSSPTETDQWMRRYWSNSSFKVFKIISSGIINNVYDKAKLCVDYTWKGVRAADWTLVGECQN